MSSTLLENLTRDEVRAIAADSVVVVPLGSTEQHGAHLPVCADTAIVTHLARLAVTEAAREVPVVMTPTLPFGFAHHHLPFGGTISIGLTTYIDVLTDIGASLYASGFRRIIFFNGHGGNDAAIRAVGDRLLYERKLDLHVAGTSYWTCAQTSLDAARLTVGGPIPGHAGGFETSCLLAIAPELVQLDRRPSPEGAPRPLADLSMARATVRRPHIWQDSDGRTDDASLADDEVGSALVDLIGHATAEFIIEFFNSSRVAAAQPERNES